jgi:hypothetical protein
LRELRTGGVSVMKKRNLVHKNALQFQKSAVHKDRKKTFKNGEKKHKGKKSDYSLNAYLKRLINDHF